MAETFEVSPESLSTYLNYMKKDDLIYHLTRGQWALTKRGERVLEDFKRSRGEKGNE
jgi:Mn-dependent DtxR family transcriptional regulator